jgi:hypothetical protein
MLNDNSSERPSMKKTYLRVMCGLAISAAALTGCGQGVSNVGATANEGAAAAGYHPDPCGTGGSIDVTVDGKKVAAPGQQGEQGRAEPAKASRNKITDVLVGFDAKNGDLRAVNVYLFQAPDGQNAIGAVAMGQQPDSVLYRAASSEKSNGKVKLKLKWSEAARDLQAGEYDLMIEATVATRDGSCPGPDQVSVEVVPLSLD